MSKAGNDPKRKQALNDATSGQFGSEPRPDVGPDVEKEGLSKAAKERRERANKEKFYAK
jgi:hypothetical protein